MDADTSWDVFLETSVDVELDFTARSSEIEDPPSFNASYTSSKPVCQSTPKAKPKAKARNTKLSARSGSSEIRAACTQCSKLYRTTAGLLRHERVHRLTELRMKLVPREEMREEMPRLAEETLAMFRELQHSSCGHLSAAVIALADSCLVDGSLDPNLAAFTSAVADGLLPCIYTEASASLAISQEEVLRSFNVLLSQSTFRQICISSFNLKRQITVNEGTFNLFFLKFCEQLLFLSLKFKTNKIVISQPDIQPDSSSKEDLIHFVGGFIVRGFANKCWRFQKSNKHFRNRLVCIQTYFLESSSNSVTPATEIAKLWTATINRGGLFILGATATLFFTKLNAIIDQIKISTESIKTNDVLNQVYIDFEILALWENLTPALNEQQKLIFLDGIVKSFTNLIGHASAKRQCRMNKIKEDAAIRTKLKK